ncbi:MAG: hypothetical protein LN416_07345 [Candidatus Thermoplasmatota archaeon]|nr:hypothetical protein [Candidatus Thermoplasmatota archaeon]
MWLGRRKSRKKPKRKRRSAKSRYDREHPVVPVRLRKSLKQQLAKEAEKEGLMLSQYIRDLLQRTKTRERGVERAAKSPIVERITKIVGDPRKKAETKKLKEAIKMLEGTISLQQGELAEASRAVSLREKDIAALKKSHSLISKDNENLLTGSKAMEKELRDKREEVKDLKASVSSISVQFNSSLERFKRLDVRYKELQSQLTGLQAENVDLKKRMEKSGSPLHGQNRILPQREISPDEGSAEVSDRLTRLSVENATLKRQLEWALHELKSNDERNEGIAQRMANAYQIRVAFVSTAWKEMPEG